MKKILVYLAEVIGSMYETEVLTKHMDSILDRTGRGSEWALKPDKVLSLLLFRAERFEPSSELAPVPGCSYYLLVDKPDAKGHSPIIGFEGIQIVGVDANPGSVRIRDGAHGPELYTMTATEVEHPVTTGVMIIGPDDPPNEQNTVVWSAFPGRLTRMAKREDLDAALKVSGHRKAVQDLQPFVGCAVKIVQSPPCSAGVGGALRPEQCDHCSHLECRETSVGY